MEEYFEMKFPYDKLVLIRSMDTIDASFDKQSDIEYDLMKKKLESFRNNKGGYMDSAWTLLGY